MPGLWRSIEVAPHFLSAEKAARTAAIAARAGPTRRLQWLAMRSPLASPSPLSFVRLLLAFALHGNALALGSDALALPALRTWLDTQAAAVAAREGWSRYEITLEPPLLPASLAACTRFEPFLPAGARFIGRVGYGLRCMASARGVAMSAAQVQAWALVPVAAEPLAAGLVLGAHHLQVQEVDVSREPAGAERRSEALIGRTLLRAVAAGQPLRADMARPTWVVQAGDPVRLRIRGGGFEAVAPAQALHGAAAGQAIRVRTDTGRIILGVAREGRTVDASL